MILHEAKYHIVIILPLAFLTSSHIKIDAWEGGAYADFANHGAADPGRCDLCEWYLLTGWMAFGRGCFPLGICWLDYNSLIILCQVPFSTSLLSRLETLFRSWSAVVWISSLGSSHWRPSHGGDFLGQQPWGRAAGRAPGPGLPLLHVCQCWIQELRFLSHSVCWAELESPNLWPKELLLTEFPKFQSSMCPLDSISIPPKNMFAS